MTYKGVVSVKLDDDQQVLSRFGVILSSGSNTVCPSGVN